MDAFNSLLTTLGLLFFLFLVLAASVEAILEMFRGLLESLGFTLLKGKYTVDDALKLASEFAAGNDALQAKLEGLKNVGQQIANKVSTNITALDVLQKNLASAAGIPPAAAAAQLNKIAGEIKTALDDSESRRIFVLRLLSAILGCLLVHAADFHILAMLAHTTSAPEWIKSLHGLENPYLNVVVGGFGAAAGSSYWHDQLDRIRNLKSAQQQIFALSK